MSSLPLSLFQSADFFGRFTVTTTVEGAVLAYHRPSTIGVRFSAPHSGRMDDRLEILFEDTALHVTFVIARVLKAIVGSQADYDLLKPTSLPSNLGGEVVRRLRRT